MEQWEIDLRAKLDKEIPDGSIFNMSHGSLILMTGKHGYIEYQVAIHHEARKQNVKFNNKLKTK